MDRELVISRIVAGCLRVRVGGRVYCIRSPHPEQVYVALEIQQEVLQDSLERGLYDEDEFLAHLFEAGLWDERREEAIRGIPDDIETLKCGLYEMQFRSDERAKIRKQLRAAKDKLAELFVQRHQHDHQSAHGLARAVRNRYLLAASLYLGQKPVFGAADEMENRFWTEQSSLLENVQMEATRLALSEGDFRELARTEPWRTLWSCRKAENTLFGIPPASYTDEQRTLVSWSMLYDNVHEHPDCPGDDVLEDDDLLDGWLIHQRKKRQSVVGKAEELVSNERVRNSDEVYKVVDTLEDARKLNQMNDPAARAIKESRWKALDKAGELSETELPDVKRKLRMQAVQMVQQAMKGQ